MKFKLLRNLYFKPVDSDFYGVYHPFNEHKIIFLRKGLYEELMKFKNPQELGSSSTLLQNGKKLVKDHFLVPEFFDQDTPIKEIVRGLPPKPKISLMYLLLTERCNLNCEYCVVEGNMKKKEPLGNMDKKTCVNAIDFFVDVCDKDLDHKVIFYGGEPFLNKDIFRYAVSRLRGEEKDKLNNLKLSVNTNATKIDEELAIFCKENDVDLAVSLDGYREVHNSQRRDICGKGSFDDVVRGYKLLQKAGISPGISCTLTRNNVRVLEQVVDFFVDELKPSEVGFNFLVDLESSKNPLCIPIGEATKAALKGFEIFRKKGIREDRIMRRLDKLVNNEIYLKDCGGCGSQVVIAPDGRIGPCHILLGGVDYPYAGNVNDREKINPKEHKLFVEWNNRVAFNMKECKECSFITICGGGCAYDSFVKTGSIWSKDERICEHCKILIDWVIDDLWKTKKKNLNIKANNIK